MDRCLEITLERKKMLVYSIFVPWELRSGEELAVYTWEFCKGNCFLKIESDFQLERKWRKFSGEDVEKFVYK